MFGVVVAPGSVLLLLFTAWFAWFFRDGMGPGFVPSVGGEALRRFWDDFRTPFFCLMPTLAAGATSLWIAWRMESKEEQKDEQVASR